MTSCPLYLTSGPLNLCHHTHTIDDITATIQMVSHPVHMWHHIPYIYDIISTKYDITTLCVDDTTLGICVTSFALQMTLHPLYHTKPQYLWCHIHFRHDITPPLSDIAPTVSVSSQPLHWYYTHVWMTSHPPSVWHHMHYIEYHIQSLCPHTTVVMKSQPLYVKPHPVCRATYPHMSHIHETSQQLSVPSHPLYRQHHTHSFYDIRHAICVTLFALYKTSHPHFTSCPLYLCHHIDCIDDITQTVFLRLLLL